MQEALEYIQMLDRISRVVRTLPERAATLAVNFSKERFRAGNWVDNTTEPWKKRSKNTWGRRERRGRALLVDTGKLRRSIRKVRVTQDEAVIGTDDPKAAIHNFGFRGRVKQHIKKHERRTRTGRTTVKAHERTIRQNIPRRQFIGASAVLDRQIVRMMTAEIKKAF